MFKKVSRWLVLIIASVTTIAFSVAAAPASTTNISADPTTGGYGTTFTISAEGFPANAVVDTWYTRPDGKTLSTGAVKASSAGAVSFSITPSSAWPAGEYIAVAHAHSGLELSTKFTVIGSSSSTSTSASSTSSTSSAGISVSPTFANYGTTFTISATGFSANALVDTWYTRPDGKSISTGAVKASSAGAVSFSITPSSAWPVGEYIAVAHARATGFELSTKFVLNGSSTTSSPTYISGEGIVVSPTSGGNGTTFTVSVGGFSANAIVDTWVTRADLKTIGLGAVTANSAGQVFFTITPSSDWPSGEYIAVAHARASGLELFVKFGFNAPPPPGSTSYPDWKGEYFDNQDLSGSPVLVRDDPTINFNWGTGSPDSSIPSDHFSVRWTRQQYFAAGTYQFTVTTDDGMRVWVGDTLLIDAWYDQSATHTAAITLDAGTYALRVEYYEDQGAAQAQVSWTTATSLNQPWTGYYYANTTLSGSPVFIRQDAQLNFNWGSDGPGGGVPGTNFSARWVSTQNVTSAGNYTVNVTADDGVRVWIDGNLVIDEWIDQTPTEYSVTQYLSAGAHTMQVEYYQHNGGAILELQIVAD